MFVTEIMMFVVAGLALFTLASWFITFFIKEN